MVRSLSRYPDGIPGAALLLLRLSCVVVAMAVVARFPLAQGSGTLAAILGGAVGLTIVAGFATRSAASLIAAASAAMMLFFPDRDVFVCIGSAGAAGALALLGPGAYSMDARLFGRRVIRVDPRSPDRGEGV